jgi:hypothetical protein
MKRVTKKFITRQRREKKRIGKMLRKKHKRIRRTKIRRHSPAVRIQAEVLTAPEVFDIHHEKYRSDLLNFIKLMRFRFKDTHFRKIIIDFRFTKKFIATGTLLFYAELRRLIEVADLRQITLRCRAPFNDLPSQVLQQIGVYKLFGYHYRGKLKHKDVVHWKVAGGNKIDATPYAHTIEKYEGSLAEPLINGVFKGLAEAMANVMEHAYPKDTESKVWWVFSQVKDGKLSVVMCDLGVGIPQTLPLSLPSLFERVKAAFGLFPPDSSCIKEAVESIESSTGKLERGRGLKNIVAAGDHGKVFIYSNRGCYVSICGKIQICDYKDSISGTLVCWILPLAKESDQ